MKKGLIILAALLFLAGCSNEAVETSKDVKNAEVPQGATDTVEEVAADVDVVPEGYSFTRNDVVIPMNVDAGPIVAALGDPAEYFEAASCAFQGLDKIYTYNGFEITTYPVEDKDYVASVYFLDDSVTTAEGIYLGSTFEDVVAAYGDEYTEKEGEYVYTLGDSTLSFIVEEDSVTAVTYSAIVEGLE